MNEKPKPITVNGVNPILWRKLRQAAIKKQLVMGEMVNEVIEKYFECEDKKNETATKKTTS
jgi:hypothetical protein